MVSLLQVIGSDSVFSSLATRDLESLSKLFRGTIRVQSFDRATIVTRKRAGLDNDLIALRQFDISPSPFLIPHFCGTKKGDLTKPEAQGEANRKQSTYSFATAVVEFPAS